MSEIAKIKTQLPTEFDPKKTKENDAKADAIIAYAKQLREWPMLEAAIEKKLEEQTEFVRWWDDAVKERGRPKK